jgi:hypothetical protein
MGIYFLTKLYRHFVYGLSFCIPYRTSLLDQVGSRHFLLDPDQEFSLADFDLDPVLITDNCPVFALFKKKLQYFLKTVHFTTKFEHYLQVFEWVYKWIRTRSVLRGQIGSGPKRTGSATLTHYLLKKPSLGVKLDISATNLSSAAHFYLPPPCFVSLLFPHAFHSRG